MPLTGEQIDAMMPQVLGLFSLDFTATEISRHLGIPVRTVRRRIEVAQSGGKVLRRTAPPDLEQLREMYGNGAGVTQICRKLGCTEAKARYWLRQLKLMPPRPSDREVRRNDAVANEQI